MLFYYQLDHYRNTIQENPNKDTRLSIHEIASKNPVCEMMVQGEMS